MASQRAELLGRVVGAQFDLERSIIELSRSGVSTAAAQNELRALGQLQGQIGRADPGALAALSSAVASAIEAAQDVSRQASAAASSNNPDATSQLVAFTSARLRAEVREDMRDIYDRKIFDEYLRFGSADDEAAYHRREEETRRAIEKALAEHTPDGDLRAAKLMGQQLADAGAHGADASPDFAERVARNQQSTAELEKAAGKAGETPAAKSAASQRDSTQPASDQQLASVLATLAATGIVGGDSPAEPAHGLAATGTTAERTRSGPA